MVSEDRSVTTSYDDSCPLLGDQPALEAQRPAEVQYTPLPKGQLMALCTARLVDPIAFTQIFPYVNEFMNVLHVTDDPSQIGFYSGVVESAFAVSQLCSIYQWAKLSDIIGRRPVVLLGIFGISITSLFFGLSRTFLGLLFARCLSGFFSGNIAVIHSVLGELTDSTNQAVAYPIYGLFWPLGAIIGPLIGGTFSNPATKFPELFDYDFFRTYPYFLPCFMAASFGLFSVVSSYFFLDETLPSKRRHKSEKNAPTSYGTIEGENAPSVSTERATFRSLLSEPIIFALSASGCALAFIATAFEVVFVLFCYSPIHAGGLAFSASQIGYSLAVAGSISAGLQLLFMPYLLRTFDNAKMYNFCMSLWPYTFISLPVLNLIARRGLDEATGMMDSRTTALLWTGIACVLMTSRFSVLAYSVSMILVKENAPSPASFGTTNGLVQFSMCFARAFSPAFVSSCFALSIENNLLGGHLWVVIMVAICFLGSSLSRKIAQGRNATA